MRARARPAKEWIAVRAREWRKPLSYARYLFASIKNFSADCKQYRAPALELDREKQDSRRRPTLRTPNGDRESSIQLP
jgi:hypothetical protein